MSTTAAIGPTTTADGLFDELIAAVTRNIFNRPRDLQTWIGPSFIGEPCDRALIAAVMEVPNRPEPPNWKATVGTAVHEYLRGMFEGGRFLCETPVTVGYVGGRAVTGSVDMYDRLSCVLVDWKTKSKTQMSNVRRNGPGQRLEVQLQTYGLGMTRLGWPVSQVCDIFLPRDGELADAFHWSAPYDERVALDAIARADRLFTLAQTFGVTVAQQQYSACTDEWCRTCNDVTKIRPGHPPAPTKDNPFGLSF
jgi:hypothetical protein